MTHMGFLIQCNANGHVSYTRKNRSSQNNFSVKRMQRSIFSNTVYKTASLPAETEPAVFSGEAPSSWYKNQLLHTWRRTKRLPVAEALTVAQSFSRFPGIQTAAPSCSSVQLCLTDVRKMSNLSRCLTLR